MKFTDLGISDPVASAVAAQGIVEPTTIQEKSIPMILDGKDVIGISRTGSGKTASFESRSLKWLIRKAGYNHLF